MTTELKETAAGVFAIKGDNIFLFSEGSFAKVSFEDAGPSKAGKSADKADKAETAAAKKKRLAAEKKAKEAEAAKAAEESDGPDKEDVRAALTALKDAKGPKATKEMLDEFGATSIGKVEESDYVAIIEAINDILGEDASDDDDDGVDPLDD